MMKKKFRALFIIFIVLLTTVFAASACDDKDADYNLTLTYDESSGAVSWYCKDADKYHLEIFEAGSDEPVFSQEFSNASDNSLSYGKAGDYIFVVKAYKQDKLIATKDLEVTVKSKDNQEKPPVDWTEIIDPDDGPVEILKKNYYYSKTGDRDLTIRLVEDSDVKSVSAFRLLNSSMWEYEKENKELIIKYSYLCQFSAGAKLAFNIEYENSRQSDINICITETIPPDIIGGEAGLIELNTSELALNYKISLGYSGKVLEEGSNRLVRKICLDGKKLSSADYLTDLSKATVAFYYTRVLSGLTEGLHYLEIYTIYGKSEVWLKVINGRAKYPYNVKIDYDTSYPNIYLTWDICNQDADYYIVEIGKREYNSKSDPQFFDNNTFDATDKISYGEAVAVKAVFDGKAQYGESSKTSLDIDITSRVVKSYLSYEKSFEFLGTLNNYYINNFDEFFDMIYYSLLFYDELENSAKTGYEKVISFYTNPKGIANVDNSFVQVVSRLNEAVKCDRLLEKSDNGSYKLHLKVQSSFVPDATPDTLGPPVVENKFQDTHLSEIGREQGYDDFAINKSEKRASVRLSEELYLAVERGVCPVPIAGSNAYIIYEKAKQVLREIIDDGMDDYQKVHAMYDWLGRNVAYDWEINDKMNGIKPNDDAYNKFYKYRQFYLEGVFIDGVAVCNGIAKAMSLMCGIEGISCYKIKGSSKGAAHAWNKVRVDGNWYVVDATWASRTYTNDYTQSKKEVLAHHTIFMSELTSGNNSTGAHYESYKGAYSDYYAGEEYNVFANTFFVYNSNLYDYVIDSVDELRVLIDYYKVKCESNQFITIDISCRLETLVKYISEINVSGYLIQASDYKGAMNGVSSVIITKR